jgi:putative protease
MTLGISPQQLPKLPALINVGAICRVEGVQGGQVQLTLEAPLRAGDGVVFDAGAPASREEGGSVMRISATSRGASSQCTDSDGRVAGGQRVSINVDGVDTGKVSVGDILWRSLDSLLESRLRTSYDKIASKDLKRAVVHASLHGSVGGLVTLRLQVRRLYSTSVTACVR